MRSSPSRQREGNKTGSSWTSALVRFACRKLATGDRNGKRTLREWCCVPIGYNAFSRMPQRFCALENTTVGNDLKSSLHEPTRGKNRRFFPVALDG